MKYERKRKFAEIGNILEMFQIDCWNMVTYQRALVRKLFYSFLLFDSPKTFLSCAMFIQRESFK